MNRIKSQKGQAIILLAFGIVALIGFTALAIDGGRVLSDRRQAQNAADTAVLAAALSKINGDSKTTYVGKGEDRAEDNKYGGAYTNSIVKVEDCGDASVIAADPCQVPSGKETEYIRVKITSVVPMTFGRVLGRQSVTNVVEAIARVQGSTSTGSFFGGAGMAATKKTDDDQCFLINGGAHLYMHGSGIFVNCSGDEALFVNGSANVTLDDDAEMAGCYRDEHNSVDFNNSSKFKCDVDQQDVSAATFASVPTLLPEPDCNSLPLGVATVSGHTVTFNPGRYTNANMPNMNNDNGLLSAGTYCFSNDLNLNAGSNLQGTGAVKIVMQGSASLNLSGSNNTFDDLEMYVNNGNLKVDGSLTATRLRFFAKGTGNYNQQNGYITSGNAYFYTYGGNFIINSQAILNLHAPPAGDTFGGLLFHKPWGNNVAFDLNGGTNSILYGTILMPTAEVKLNGGSNMEVHGQIIASTFIINGSNQADVYYDPKDNYNPPNDPTIELTK